MSQKKTITIISTPHERAKSEIIKDIPKAETEFYQIVNNATWSELKEYGFRKWATMNEVIKENIGIEKQDRAAVISIPTYTVDEAVGAIDGIFNGNPLPPSGS